MFISLSEKLFTFTHDCRLHGTGTFFIEVFPFKLSKYPERKTLRRFYRHVEFPSRLLKSLSKTTIGKKFRVEFHVVSFIRQLLSGACDGCK